MKRLATIVLFAAALSALAMQPPQKDDPPPPPPAKAKQKPPEARPPQPPREERPELARLHIPENDKKAAAKALKKWLTARAVECSLLNDEVLDFRRNGVLLNLYPFVFTDALDRLRLVAIFFAKDEFKNSEELEKFAAQMNKKQNFLTVYVTNDGHLAIAGNMTFVDELTAKEFDYFVDLMTFVIRQHILPSPEVKKLLK